MSDTPSAKPSLTPEQRQVVETWGQGIAVMAGAGSGKTFTLVQKVRALLEKNLQARFAAVSFTEKSAKDLREKLTSLSLEILGRPLQGQWVTTIHGLCSSIIREYPREAGFDGDEVMASESESQAMWEQATESFWFDDLPTEVEEALERFLERESRDSFVQLLTRVRNLFAMNILDELESAPDLRVLAAYAIEKYDRLKRRRGALDFNDLEIGADRALAYDHVRADYRARFDLVMVDEFQDTNPVQARILTAFTKPGFSNLCVVGDPKQSIYRFRDADVSVFSHFCAQLPVNVALTRNYRSVPGVLEFCNVVCEPAFLASDMEYQALTPAREPDSAFPAVEAIEVQTPEGLVAWIERERAKGVDLSEMALLLRKIRGKPEKWLKALTTAGIPIAIESGGLLWSDPRARELCSLLKWWSNPGNEYSGAVFFRAPWCGIEDRTIDEWRAKDPSFVGPFFASSHPLAVLLKPLYARRTTVRPGELLLALLQSDAVEKELGPLVLALWHRSEELSSRGYDFQRVALDLAEACEEGRREKSVPPPKNAGQLRVMTIHGSKGLEFPHVILLDFPEKAERAPEMPLLFWDREEGAYLGGRDEEGERLKEDALEAKWRKWEEEKELAESKRVLYVALTRAMTRLVCVLPTTLDPKARESVEKHRAKIEDPLKKDYWRAWIEKGLKIAEESNEAELKKTKRARSDADTSEAWSLPKELPKFVQKRPRHSVSEWNTLSRCERAYEWVAIRPDEDEIEPREWIEGLEPDSRAPSRKIAQNEVGTAVHRCLELNDEIGLRDLEKELGSEIFQAEPVIEWLKSSPLMRGERVWKEFAFEIPIGSEALVGAMDRLIYSEADGYTLIDFKITTKRKSEAELLEAYATQLNLYGWALEVLEPTARGKIRLKIVNIAPGGVREIDIPLRSSELDRLAAQSTGIIGGRAGRAIPGHLCRVCEFRSRCDEGTSYLKKLASKN